MKTVFRTTLVVVLTGAFVGGDTSGSRGGIGGTRCTTNIIALTSSYARSAGTNMAIFLTNSITSDRRGGSRLGSNW